MFSKYILIYIKLPFLLSVQQNNVCLHYHPKIKLCKLYGFNWPKTHLFPTKNDSWFFEDLREGSIRHLNNYWHVLESPRQTNRMSRGVRRERTTYIGDPGEERRPQGSPLDAQMHFRGLQLLILASVVRLLFCFVSILSAIKYSMHNA